LLATGSLKAAERLVKQSSISRLKVAAPGLNGGGLAWHPQNTVVATTKATQKWVFEMNFLLNPASLIVSCHLS
jgi:hypothetical protein